MLSIPAIAKIVHQANKAYCEALGDFSQREWESAAAWQQDSAIDGIRKVIDGEANTPEEQHQAWCDFKKEDGWIYGPRKDEFLKTHPCLVPYNELPAEQRRKDHLFRAIVQAMTEEV